jgi:beta-lactamase class D
MRKTALLAVFLYVLAGAARAEPRWVDVPAWKAHFEAAGVRGTFLLYDAKADAYFVFDRARAGEPLLPASTFKIPNSLIGLESGAVRDADEVLEWDGVQRMVPAWNRDTNMRDAFRNSTVWFYQEIARRVGPQRMRAHLAALRYGNGDIGGGIDRFWLDGGLRISAHGQVAFLRALQRDALPYAPRTLATVKAIMVHEQGEGYVLRAKTGWAGFGEAQAQQIGWWVGWVERNGDPYFFAMNVDLEKPEQGAARFAITKAILRERRLLP